MSIFYIASRLENAPAVRELRDHLVTRGMTCAYDWTEHGSVRGPHAWLAEIKRVAHAKAEAAATADLVVFLLPGGRGAHVEFGIAVANAGRVVLWSPCPDVDFGVGEEVSCFYHLDGVEQRGDASMLALAEYLVGA